MPLVVAIPLGILCGLALLGGVFALVSWSVSRPSRRRRWLAPRSGIADKGVHEETALGTDSRGPVEPSTSHSIGHHSW